MTPSCVSLPDVPSVTSAWPLTVFSSPEALTPARPARERPVPVSKCVFFKTCVSASYDILKCCPQRLLWRQGKARGNLSSPRNISAKAAAWPTFGLVSANCTMSPNLIWPLGGVDVTFLTVLTGCVMAKTDFFWDHVGIVETCEGEKAQSVAGRGKGT